jgi:phosphatidylserine/phosphatidylglycerophosphate/cardiolipin synthase-like enzyme/uncharacterized membrane protein YdjX (TVP38/TMEM64 family)
MNSSILQPGRNIWRIERAARAAVLIDGAEFFGAVRRAFLNARRSIFIAGWDIDSRTRLVGDSNGADDGHSPVLADFLSELVESRPDLHIYLLLWDYSIIYAAEREILPRLSLQWRTPERVTLCLDDAVPFGSSQHQKLIVVDDALAFSGGLDVTLRRWDTSEHKAENPDRVDAAGEGYPPFHDVQMMVDGKAAEALAELVRNRWCRAHETKPPIRPVGDPWPQNVQPHFRDVNIGIARTEPPVEGKGAVREVETLFLDSISHAERFVYIENQFVSAMDVAKRLARRLEERRELEAVIVSPRSYQSWVVSQTLGNERSHVMELLKRAGGDRVRMVYPTVNGGDASADTMVHSKVMVVDDKFLRVGSANLNNRSMGADTECDLVIEAENDVERGAIETMRNRLIGDHCGVGPDAVASMLAECGSLVRTVDRLAANGHSLRPIEDEKQDGIDLTGTLKLVVDPKRPLRLSRVWNRLRPAASKASVAVLVMTFLIVLLTLGWYLTSSDIVSRESIQSLLSSVSGSIWALPLVLAVFLIGGAIAFPVTVMIVATAAIFGPLFGILYAALGVIASALLMYFVGAWLGRDILRTLLGSKCERVKQEMANRGVLAVAAIRMVPAAPFTLVNLMAGACSIAVVDYVIGTLIGILPGLIAIALLGHQLTALLTNFSAQNAAVVVLLIGLWIGIAFGAQALVVRWRGHAS